MKILTKVPVLNDFYSMFSAPLGDEQSDTGDAPLVEFNSKFLDSFRKIGRVISQPGVNIAR